MVSDTDFGESDTPSDPPSDPPPAPEDLLQAALDKMNHPSNIDLHSRLDAMQNAINVMATLLSAE